MTRRCGVEPQGSADDQSYTFDAAGNRLTKTIGGSTTTYTYNDANQLTSATDQTSTPAYDGNGSQTTAPDGTTTAYTPMDQTASLTPDGGSTVDMDYADIDSTERTEVGSTSLAHSILGLAQLDTGSSTVHFIRDSLGNLLGRTDGTDTHYYLVDALGSIVKLVDDDGAVVNHTSYDPWGIPTTHQATIDDPWGYAAGYHHPDTGLTKFGTRYYRPDTGRWTQQDPTGLEQNPYLYGEADPVNRVDPTGTLSDCAVGAIALTVVGGVLGGLAGGLLVAGGATAAVATSGATITTAPYLVASVAHTIACDMA